MSWSAAVFGELRFPSRAKLAAWWKRTCDSASWDDWVGELENDERGPATVEAVLNALGTDLQTKALVVTVRIDQFEEDGFRDDAAQLGAAFRASEQDGAVGDVYFIGGYGAMGDFAYHLHVAGGKSQLRAIPKKQRPAIYDLARAAGLFADPRTEDGELDSPTTDFDEFSRAAKMSRYVLQWSFRNLITIGRREPIDARWAEPAFRVATSQPQDDTAWFALTVAALAKHPQAFETIRSRIGTANIGAICQAFEALRDPRAIPIIQGLPASPTEKKYLVKPTADKLRRWAKQSEAKKARPAKSKASRHARS